MCGLFSSFDPVFVGWSLLSKWFTFLVLLILVNWRMFSLLVSVELIYKQIVMFCINLISQSMSSKSVSLVLSSTFVFFLFSNLIGLIPWQFTSSSHLSVNLSISLSLWLVSVIVMMKDSFDKFLSHLVPTGSPELLWPLLVMVETISMIIRPMTLGIRLMANIMAGHLIMNLIGEFSSFAMMFILPLPLSVELMLLMFESCVGVIQAYVFKNLLTLYWAESE
nr:ATP synthase F0 subunit 6 [Goniodes ortygis]